MCSGCRPSGSVLHSTLPGPLPPFAKRLGSIDSRGGAVTQESNIHLLTLIQGPDGLLTPTASSTYGMILYFPICRFFLQTRTFSQNTWEGPRPNDPINLLGFLYSTWQEGCGGTMERGMRLRYDVVIHEKPIHFTRLSSYYHPLIISFYNTIWQEHVVNMDRTGTELLNLKCV